MLIVDMPMPLRCPCGLAEDNNGWYAPCFAYYGVPEREKEFDRCVERGTRPYWCPIKGELPDEHGDLIDRDVSIQTFKCIEEAPYSGFDGQEAFYTPEDVVNTLLCQDVVIADDRSNLCAILATAGYAVCVEERCDYSRSFPYKFYVVVVYGKDGETDGNNVRE